MLIADTRYTTLLKCMKSHSYPKSTIEIQSLLSLQAAIRALKSLEDCLFLHQLPPIFIQVNQLDLSEGPLSYKLSTPLRAECEHEIAAAPLSSCGTGTGRTQGDFA